MEKTRYDVRNVADGRKHCVLMWRKILFKKPCQGYTLFCYHFVSFVFVFFVSCSYSLCFL